MEKLLVRRVHNDSLYFMTLLKFLFFYHILHLYMNESVSTITLFYFDTLIDKCNNVNTWSHNNLLGIANNIINFRRKNVRSVMKISFFFFFF